MLCKAVQSTGVGKRVRTYLQREIVTAEFALLTNAGVDPPDGGVEEEEGLRDCLEDVPEEISAAHVGELVRENDFEFVRAERGNGAQREKDDSAQCADRHWTVDRAGDAQSDYSMKPQCRADAIEAGAHT